MVRELSCILLLAKLANDTTLRNGPATKKTWTILRCHHLASSLFLLIFDPYSTTAYRLYQVKIKDGFNGQRSIVLPAMSVEMMKADPLTSPLYITDIGYYPHAQHHCRTRREPIDQCVLIYCIDGAGYYDLDGKRHHVSSHSYFVLPAGRPHSYGSDSEHPWTIYWVHFGGIRADSYAACARVPRTVAPSGHSRIETLLNLFEEIFDTLRSSLTIESMRYAMAAFDHFLAMLFFNKSCPSEYRNDGDDIVEQTIHFLNENLERHLAMSDISAFTGYSPTHLSALFKARTGYSILSYFNILRIRKACRLLDTTSMKINQISFKTGITDPLYFSRLFTRIMGVSPKAYRNRVASEGLNRAPGSRTASHGAS